MLGQFLTPSFNPRNVKRVAANTTLTASDNEVKVNGAYTMTLPAITSLFQDGNGGVAFKIYNAGTSTVTISCNAADTIEDGSAAGTTSIYLYANTDYVVLRADLQKKQWKHVWPSPVFNASAHNKDYSVTGEKTEVKKYYGSVVVDTNGTTAVNVFSSSGAPCALTITGITGIAQDTNAANITLTNGTSTVSTFAKSTTLGAVTGEDGDLTYSSVTASNTLTVVSNATNGDARCTITFTVP